jgi:hypothetical protein
MFDGRRAPFCMCQPSGNVFEIHTADEFFMFHNLRDIEFYVNDEEGQEIFPSADKIEMFS